MGKIIVFASGGKGGVGKSVCAVNLCGALANKGNRVAIIDTDTGLKEQGGQGVQSASSWARLRTALIDDGEFMPEVVSYSFSPEDKIHIQLKDIASNHDYVVVDTPGSTTTALRSIAAIADVIYLPINCSRDEFLKLPPIFELARGVEEMIEGAGIDRKLDVRILPCRIDPKWKLDREEFDDWYDANAADISSISAVTIPYAKPFSQTVSFGVSLHDEKNKYRASFDLLVDEINGKRKLRAERI